MMKTFFAHLFSGRGADMRMRPIKLPGYSSESIYLFLFNLTFFNVDIYNSFINKITNLNRLNIKMKKRKKKKERNNQKKNHHNNGH